MRKLLRYLSKVYLPNVEATLPEAEQLSDCKRIVADAASKGGVIEHTHGTAIGGNDVRNILELFRIKQ